jgi:hypothetical protein
VPAAWITSSKMLLDALISPATRRCSGRVHPRAHRHADVDRVQATGFAHIRSSYEGRGGRSGSSGWSAWTFVALRSGPGIVAGAGLPEVGGGTGKNVRIGVEVHPSTFRR